MRVQIRLITTDGSDPKSRQRNEWSSEDALTKEKIKTVAKWLRADKAIIKQKNNLIEERKRKERRQVRHLCSLKLKSLGHLESFITSWCFLIFDWHIN